MSAGQSEWSRAWEAGWDAHTAFVESGGLTQALRREARIEVADRLAAWQFPAGSDALAPICLLVAELRADA